MRKTPVDIEIPYSLRKLRQVLRLTQIKMADEVGIAEITIKSYEQGLMGIGPEIMLKMAETAGRKANEPGYDHAALRKLQTFFLSRVEQFQEQRVADNTDENSLFARKMLRLEEQRSASGDVQAAKNIAISKMNAAELHSRHAVMLREATGTDAWNGALRIIEREQGIAALLRLGRKARERSGGE